MNELIEDFCKENGLTLNGKKGGDLKPGDLYVACRNTGPKLLRCKFVDKRRWVVPMCDAYPYDWWECFGVEPYIDIRRGLT